ncbi:hypothetical protein BKA70DRAFT_768550 [Coprinopsis sp. MPI-PUGE-AT-0042]|nr:hypothetical protein BKA70DRAFT_768550 [Coprinopsis sp. MPI-PUGE-AT-0042]
MAIDETAATIGSLPLEIVQEIFVLALPRDSKATNSTATFAPLRLCHVSSAWRQFAFSEPRIWRSLRLPIQGMERAQSPARVAEVLERLSEIAAFWIDKSGDLGLHLVFYVPTFMFKLFDSACGIVPLSSINDKDKHLASSDLQLLDAFGTFVQAVFVDKASRIRELEVRAFSQPSTNCVAAILSRISPHFERLESVFLQGGRLPIFPCRGEPSMGRSLFPTAPQLRRIALVFCTIGNLPRQPMNLPTDYLPWHQLTHIMIKASRSESWWRTVLLQCKQLENCLMHVERDSEEDGRTSLTPGSYIELEHLDHLDITFHDECTTLYFHDFLFPVLRYATVACDLGNGDPNLEWLPSSQSHLGSLFKGLTSLTLSYQKIRSSELLNILRETEGMEELWVDSYLADHKGFLKALTLQPDQLSRPIIPRLRLFSLYLEYQSEEPPSTFEEEHLLGMMASRNPLVSEVARHLCVKNAVDVEGVHSVQDPTARALVPNRLLSSALNEVELWVDTDADAKFELLEKLEELMEASDKGELGEISSLPQEILQNNFSFLLDSQSPSEWLPQKNEPIWYNEL